MSQGELTTRIRYGARAATSLRVRARELAAAPDLREELALQRALLEDALEAYDFAVQESQGLDQGRQIRARVTAGGLVALAIERIEQTALAQLKVASARVMLMPDVSELIETLIGTVDLELATRATNLRMAGLDPAEFMDALAGKIRAASRVVPELAMAETGPSGYAEAQEAANAEAADMDDTVPEHEVA